MIPERSTQSAPTPEPIVLGAPSARDAADVWRLVERTPSLDANSPYAYLLLCTHFAGTGVVARLGAELAGFVLGYARPDDGSTAFVWQVAVAEHARGRGLGVKLLDAWFARCARRSDVRFLEATVTPSNQASQALFTSFARRHGAPLRRQVAYESSLFPSGVPHEDEVAIRVGPVFLSRVFAVSHQENDPTCMS